MDSQIARDFQTNALPRGKLKPGQVPGIDRDSIRLLYCHDHEIETVDELVGEFFRHQRDEAAFKRFLTQARVNDQSARVCAASLARKLGSL